MAAGSAALRVAVLFTLPAVALGDEMAFVDVSSTDTINIRSLDGGFASKRGIANLFVDDPMAPHDYTLTKILQTTLKAELAAAELPESIAGRKIKHLEEVLQPLYVAMPKNENGLLDRTAVRYIAHRYFTAHHGWSIKGLEPAGAAWLATVPLTSSVRQLTKWIVPTFLLENLEMKADHRGLDLHGMATFAATIEHLIHAEMTEILYSVHRTMQVQVNGDKTAEEVDLIVSVFMMVYAIGINLELSTKNDMELAKAHLESNHQAWPELEAWAKRLPGWSELTTSGFPGMLSYVEHLADQYGQFQDRDCSRAKKLLLRSEAESDTFGRGHGPGRTHLMSVKESRERGYRSLFVESFAYLRKLGVLDDTNPDDPQLVVPNYLASQTMCLTTASFYTVCCRNECDEVLVGLERAVAAPSAPTEDVVKALRASGREIQEALLEELRAESGGEVHLHQTTFSKWLHKAFPNECADPTDHAVTNPKTADQWMSDPGEDVQETEDLIAEVASVLKRFATDGLDENASAMADLPEPEDEDQVEASFSVSEPQVPEALLVPPSSMLEFSTRAITFISAICLAVALAWRSS